MVEVEIRRVNPLFYSRLRGFKVLTYRNVNGTRTLCGSRYFDGLDGAERYKKEIEEREARKGSLEDV